jgi:very-short-patch-repair endonuclease
VRSSVQTLKRARKLRTQMTLPEILLWQELRGRKLNGLAFRRQHGEDPYVLDFFCTKVQLAVEIDGIVHESRGEHDARRDAWLAERGIRTLRIPATDILKRGNMENVLETIARAAAPSTAFGGPPPPLRGGGS